MSDPTLALEAVLALVIGAVLVVSGLSAMADPFWSRRTRITSFIGVVVGFVTILIGLVQFLVAMS